MDIAKLFEPVKNTSMPDDMRLRILSRCHSAQRGKALLAHKTVLIAAALILAFCITAVGTVRSGFFMDIKNIFGAITGIEYMNATEEIRAEAMPEGEAFMIRAEFLVPDTSPYAEIEALSIGAYQILDGEGNVIFTGTETEAAQFSDRQAVIRLPSDIASEEASVIVIHSFISHKKADQPMEIHGMWKCTIRR